MSAESQSLGLSSDKGLNGGEVVSDAAIHTPPDGVEFFTSIYALNAVAFALSNAVHDQGIPIDAYDGISLVPGQRLYGRFTSVQLASGSAKLYY